MELMMNNQAEIDLLLSYMQPGSIVLEWGSGGSTLEILKHVKALYSIEHDENWYRKIYNTVPKKYSSILNYWFVARNSEEAPGDDGTLENYYHYINKPKEFGVLFDVIFIDGRARVECAKVAVQLLKPGGVIIIHDMLHPQPEYRRYEYETVLDFLDLVKQEFALCVFIPKQIKNEEMNELINQQATERIHRTSQTKPVITIMTDTYQLPQSTIDKAETMGWYMDGIIQAMNDFYDKEIKGHDLSNHGHVKHYIALLERADSSRGNKMIDLGTGSGMISDYSRGWHFEGSDLAPLVGMCAMRNYPQYKYRACDAIRDDVQWINEYDMVVMNGFIDIMPDALLVFKKILQHCSRYVLLHRQEITEQGATTEIVNGNHYGNTFHSIINRQDFLNLLDEMNFDIISEEHLPFGNWENGGGSFLLCKRQSWALHKLDHQLYSKYFKGKTSGVYIEAGANDGVTQSNTMFFEKYKGWNGMLIEPVFQHYCDINKNRNPGSNIIMQAALVADLYGHETIDMFWTPASNGLLSVVDTPGAETMLKRDNGEKIKFSVQALSLNKILAKIWEPTAPIDLLVLDVEGYEKEALKGIDFDTWYIDYLLVEQLDGDTITAMLQPWYDLVEIMAEHDYLYKRKF